MFNFFLKIKLVKYISCGPWLIDLSMFSKDLPANIKKTKVMVVTNSKDIPKLNIKIDNKEIVQVKSYTYLGQLITEDGRSEQEIKRRI